MKIILISLSSLEYGPFLAQTFHKPTLYLITMTLQTYTLKDLKQCVDLYIEREGENAACAYWVYTKDDVAFCDENGDMVMHEINLSNSVLTSLWHCDSVHTAINDCIECCVEEYQKDLQALGF